MNKKINTVLTITVIIIITTILGTLIWLNKNNQSIDSAQAGMQAFLNGSPFYYTLSGDVYITKIDCEYKRPTWESSPRYVKIKLDGIKKSDVETVSKQFVKIKGKLYDGFYSEFKKQGIEKTNNIGTAIDVKTLKVVDVENEYFQDKNGLYYYSNYPTVDACFSPSPEGRYNGPIIFQNILLQSPEEIQLYRGQENNIFVSGEFKDPSWTRYAKLNGALYWKNLNGQFIKISGADPENFRLLSKEIIGSELYTNGKNVFFNGNITEIDPTTFKEIMYPRLDNSEKLASNFFVANSHIYYFARTLYSGEELSTLIKTDADASTFEIINTNDSYSGLIFRDKDYIYKYNKNKKAFDKIAR